MKRPDHRCLLVGLGRRAIDDHLPALYPPVLGIELVGVCDINPKRLDGLEKFCHEKGAAKTPPLFQELGEALDKTQPDFAIVSTPHTSHMQVAEELLKRNIPFLKEKPFAISLSEARTLVSLIERHRGHMRLCVQRHFHPLYVYGQKAIRHLGVTRHFAARYQLNATQYYTGWRSRSTSAGGGAVIDMGYHLIDLLHWYFGRPCQVFSMAAPKRDVDMTYEVEETVLTSFGYDSGMVGSLFLSLCEPDRSEELKVYGTTGYFHLQRGFLKRYDRHDAIVESLTREPAWPSAVADVLIDFFAKRHDPHIVRDECSRGLEVMSIIDAIYRSIRSTAPVDLRTPAS